MLSAPGVFLNESHTRRLHVRISHQILVRPDVSLDMENPLPLDVVGARSRRGSCPAHGSDRKQ